MKREELLNSREYWLTKIQFDLFRLIDEYKSIHKINQTDIANMLGVSKGYISQILHGDYDHRISKIVDISLAFGKVAEIKFTDIKEYIRKDEEINNRYDAIQNFYEENNVISINTQSSNFPLKPIGNGIRNIQEYDRAC